MRFFKYLYYIILHYIMLYYITLWATPGLPFYLLHGCYKKPKSTGLLAVWTHFPVSFPVSVNVTIPPILRRNEFNPFCKPLVLIQSDLCFMQQIQGNSFRRQTLLHCRAVHELRHIRDCSLVCKSDIVRTARRFNGFEHVARTHCLSTFMSHVM